MLINRRSDASRDSALKEAAPQITLAKGDQGPEVKLSGAWTTRTVAHVDAAVRKIEKDSAIKDLRVDLSGIERIDTAGAWLVERLLAAVRARGAEPVVAGGSEAVGILLGAVEEAARR